MDSLWWSVRQQSESIVHTGIVCGQTMMDYSRLWWTMADYGRLLTMVSNMASFDGWQWVRRTMTALLLSFTAVETMDIVLLT